MNTKEKITAYCFLSFCQYRAAKFSILECHDSPIRSEEELIYCPISVGQVCQLPRQHQAGQPNWATGCYYFFRRVRLTCILKQKRIYTMLLVFSGRSYLKFQCDGAEVCVSGNRFELIERHEFLLEGILIQKPLIKVRRLFIILLNFIEVLVIMYCLYLNKYLLLSFPIINLTIYTKFEFEMRKIYRFQIFMGNFQ